MASHAQSSPFPSASVLPTKEQQCHSHRPQLQSLPVARDSHGRSPFLLSLQSPRLSGTSASPNSIRSPAAQLLESLTPRLTRQASQSSLRQSPACGAAESQEKREEMVMHLETCLRASEAAPKEEMRKEVLRGCTSREAGKLVVGCGSGSIVACEGSPTARAVYREFPEAIAAKYSEGEAALAALEGHKAHRALLPVESSMHGTVHRTYDLLLRYNVHIVGELIESSCSAYEEEDIHRKRFWVVAREACMLPREAASFKTAVALVLREGLGALHKVLAAFAFRDIPITKLESRPWRAQPLRPPPAAQRHADAAGTHRTYFQYVLFIEFQSSTASRAAQNALAQLQQLSSFLRLLGTYPSFHTTPTALTPRHRIPHISPRLPEPVLVSSSS